MRWPSLTPTEHQEQKAVIQWAFSMKEMMPEALLIFAIPNGGLRPRRLRYRKVGKVIQFSPEGKKLRAEGVRPGVPDLFLPVPRLPWHGLFIEMKRLNGSPTIEQTLWKGLLTSQGYAVCVCRGADEAIDAIMGYLSRPKWSPDGRDR